MIKLFIFESVADARAFEQPAETVRVEPKPEAADPAARTLMGFPVFTALKSEPMKNEPEERPRKKYTRHANKPARKSKKSAGGDYTPEQVIALAKRIAKGEIKAKQAAKELGLTISGWYQAKARHAGDIKKGATPLERPEQAADGERHVMDADEIREAVREGQEQGLDSLRIAQKLKISLAQVNKYWDPQLALSMQGKEQEDELE